MSRRAAITWALVVAVVSLCVASFVIGSAHQSGSGDERFTGSDDAAVTAISAAAPHYQPWFQPVFEPASGEVESGLFALQAALGGTVLGFSVGALWGRRRAEAELAASRATDPAHEPPSQPDEPPATRSAPPAPLRPRP